MSTLTRSFYRETLFAHIHTPDQKGSAINSVGDLKLLYCSFIDNSARDEGGSIYLTGNGNCSIRSCCFERSYCTYNSLEIGGNTFAIYDHHIITSEVSIFLCSPFKTVTATPAILPGDSTFTIKRNKFEGKKMNNSNNHGYWGSLSGRFDSSEQCTLSFSIVTGGEEYDLIEAWSGVVVVDHVIFSSNKLGNYYLYTISSAAVKLKFEWCSFYENSLKSNFNTRVEFSDCSSSSSSYPATGLTLIVKEPTFFGPKIHNLCFDTKKYRRKKRVMFLMALYHIY